ncbi:MAG: type I-E CRISPR-associated protein Cas5/CasD [Betaproteobacteria bacterium]|nr:type I-E CRISPR-associated protein Cas5/CasD [Betaproteobacteria bacterium]
MPTFLILRLDGPMQAWGTHTFEDFRPSHLYPTRSGLLGLLGACLGLERGDLAGQRRLANSVAFTVRVDKSVLRSYRVTKDGPSEIETKAHIKLPDFHTVMDARKVDGKEREYPIVSRREYLFDAAFTVAVGGREAALAVPSGESGSADAGLISLDELAAAVRRPVYTPSLGRRSCPLARPLLEKAVEADSARAALDAVAPQGGVVYCESESSNQPLRLRDVPLHGPKRQFGVRTVYLHRGPSCS